MTESPAIVGPTSAPRRGRRLGLSLLALVALLAGGAALWHNVLQDRFIPKRFGVVEAGRLYRSGQLAAALVKPTLADHGIKLVVDMTGESPDDPDQQAESRAVAELGIRRVKFPLRGNGTGDIRHYAQALAAIHEARQRGEPVLVHCAAGTQRTGGVIATYRMLIEGRPAAEAYREMTSFGVSARHDQILLDYLNDHMAELAELLVQMGVIERVPDPLPVLKP